MITFRNDDDDHDDRDGEGREGGGKEEGHEEDGDGGHRLGATAVSRLASNGPRL